MPFQYSCFISYCHGQHDLVRAFLDQFKAALKNELDTLLDEEIYVDEERLKPGYKYNEALAQAICQSACMIVIYSPRYERHDYCIREFRGMVRLEESRGKILKAILKEKAAGVGCIIPIILRGADAIPEWIKESRHYSDFSRFTLATPDITRNPEYVEQIRKIAGVILEYWQAFRAAQTDPCVACTDFALPGVTEIDAKVTAWRPPFVNR